jgi:hypothetical protein
LSSTIGGPPVKDLALLDWCSKVISSVLLTAPAGVVS